MCCVYFREKEDFLLVAQRDKIARISLGVDSSFEKLPIFGLKNVIAIEFDMANNCVYWADIINDTIGVSTLFLLQISLAYRSKR